MERIRVRVTVSGRVQGVFFRSSVEELATDRGVAGWVRNTRSGSVEAELEGARDDVEAIVAFCREGPELAEVEGVEVTELEVSQHDGADASDRFEVR